MTSAKCDAIPCDTSAISGTWNLPYGAPLTSSVTGATPTPQPIACGNPWCDWNEPEPEMLTPMAGLRPHPWDRRERRARRVPVVDLHLSTDAV